MRKTLLWSLNSYLKTTNTSATPNANLRYSFSILEAYWKQNYRCEQIITAQFFLIFFFIASDVLVNIIMIFWKQQNSSNIFVFSILWMYSTPTIVLTKWHINARSGTSCNEHRPIKVQLELILSNFYYIVWFFFFKIHSIIYRYFYSFYSLNKDKAGRKVLTVIR